MKSIQKYILLTTIIFTAIILTSCGGSTVEFVISFDSNGGSHVSPIITDGSLAIRMPDDPIKEGYVFAGWYWDNNTFRDLFTVSSLLERGLSSNLTVYAKWTEDDQVPIGSVKVTFNSMGGSEVSPVFVQPGRTILIPQVNRVGYTLDGWYTSLNDGVTLDERWSFTNNIVYNDITLYANRSDLKSDDQWMIATTSKSQNNEVVRNGYCEINGRKEICGYQLGFLIILHKQRAIIKIYENAMLYDSTEVHSSQ